MLKVLSHCGKVNETITHMFTQYQLPFADPCKPACKSYDTCIEEDFGLFSDVRYFQLGGIDIPKELDSRFQRALILQERQAHAKLTQEAVIIRKESDQLVSYMHTEL